MSERPIFIVGHPHSGTTLLRFILSSHPRIYIPSETGFIPFLIRNVEGRLSQANVARQLDRIGQLNRAWHVLVDDVPSFYCFLPEPRLGPLLGRLYYLQIEPHGALRWGDKTPAYVRYIPLLTRICPTAQFMHIIRDGRDVALSMLDKWGHELHIDVYFAARNWVRRIRQAQDSGARLGPALFYELRYENLVADPRGRAATAVRLFGRALPARNGRTAAPGPRAISTRRFSCRHPPAARHTAH